MKYKARCITCNKIFKTKLFPLDDETCSDACRVAHHNFLANRFDAEQRRRMLAAMVRDTTETKIVYEYDPLEDIPSDHTDETNKIWGFVPCK